MFSILKQKNIDKLMLTMAELTSDFSTCISKKVGCVIVKDGRIISQGYNGTPAGFINCNKKYESLFIKETFLMQHSEFNLKYEIHAEMNAILFAAKNGLSVEGATCYVNYQPCWDCAKNMIQAGIKKIIYKIPWNKMSVEDILQQKIFLNLNKVLIIKFGEETDENL